MMGSWVAGPEQRSRGLLPHDFIEYKSAGEHFGHSHLKCPYRYAVASFFRAVLFPGSHRDKPRVASFDRARTPALPRTTSFDEPTADMEDNFRRLQRTPPDPFDYLFVLGPPIMRGAIVFSGSSHPTLVDGICDRLGSKRGSASLGNFANGETSVSIRTSRVPNCTLPGLRACRHLDSR